MGDFYNYKIYLYNIYPNAWQNISNMFVIVRDEFCQTLRRDIRY